MAEEFDWSEFEGNRWGANAVGDKIAGRVRSLRVEKARDGAAFPVLSLQVDQDGNEREVWAGATDLKAQLAALRPQIGWWVEIEFVGTKATGQASPMKLFEVKGKEAKPTAIEVVEAETNDFGDELI